LLKQNKNVLQVYCDGGSRGNPGPAACGFVIFDEEGKQLVDGKKYLGRETNNFAEYSGVLMALEWVVENVPGSSLKFYLDSQLICRQMRGEYKVKSKKLLPLYEQIEKLSEQVKGGVEFEHVYREKNKIADGLVNEALDENVS
jgi:ribonuclease HI